jgi:uncharacterized integral membrane protein (TIGR00698 family)
MRRINAQYAIEDSRNRSLSLSIAQKLPGIALASALAAAAFLTVRIPLFAHIHPMIVALAYGIALCNVLRLPAFIAPGISFCQRHLLRIAVALLGIQLSLGQLASVGITGVCIILVMLVATMIFTKLLGRALGVDRHLSELLASGTAICGISAIVATNTVTQAPEEDVTYAIATVTLLGTLLTVIYPMVLPLLALDAYHYGLWTGSSIHEVAQVAAAAFQGGDASGAYGTAAKLLRVVMLAPVVLVLGWWAARRGARSETSRAGITFPWFVVGFLALASLNSVSPVSAGLREFSYLVTMGAMTVALAAMGLMTDISKLKGHGPKPFFLGVLSALFLSSGTLTLVLFIH